MTRATSSRRSSSRLICAFQVRRQGAAIARLQFFQPRPAVTLQRLIITDALGEEQPLDPVDVFHSLANERLALPADPAAVFLFGCRRLDHRAHPRFPAFVG